MLMVGDQASAVEPEKDHPRVVVVWCTWCGDRRRRGPLGHLKEVAALQAITGTDDARDRRVTLGIDDPDPPGRVQHERCAGSESPKRDDAPDEVLLPHVDALGVPTADHQGVGWPVVVLRGPVLGSDDGQ